MKRKKINSCVTCGRELPTKGSRYCNTDCYRKYNSPLYKCADGSQPMLITDGFIHQMRKLMSKLSHKERHSIREKMRRWGTIQYLEKEIHPADISLAGLPRINGKPII